MYMFNVLHVHLHCKFYRDFSESKEDIYRYILYMPNTHALNCGDDSYDYYFLMKKNEYERMFNQNHQSVSRSFHAISGGEWIHFF